MLLKKKNISALFLILLCFPFLPILGFFPNSDTGIHVLVLSFSSMFFITKKIPSYIFIIFSLIIFSTIINVNIELIQYARFINVFIVHFSVFFLTHYLLKTDHFLLKKSLLIVYSIYIFGAFFQLIFPEIFSSLFSFIRTSSNRGLTSFASEPSSLALNCFLILISLKIMGLKSRAFYLNLFLVIILSLNSVILFILISAIFISTILKIKIKNFIKIMFIILISFVLISKIEFFQSSRVFRNINLLFSNPELLLLDSSVNRRISHMIFPILGFFKGYFILPSFSMTYTKDVFQILSSAYPLFSGEIGGNVMSGLGQLITNLGIFGLGIFGYIYFKVFKSNKISLFIKISFFIIFINSISISWATFVILISLIFYIDKKNLHWGT